MHHAPIAFEQRSFEIDAFFSHYCYRSGKDWGGLYRAIWAIARERLDRWNSNTLAEANVDDLTSTILAELYAHFLEYDGLTSMGHAYNYARRFAKSRAIDHRGDFEAVALPSKTAQARWKRREVHDGVIHWDQPERTPGYENFTKRELDQIDPTLWQVPPMTSVSLSTPLSDDLDEDSPTTIADTLVDPSELPADALERSQDTTQRRNALDALPPKDREFLHAVLAYMHDAHDEPWTQAARDRGSTNPQAYGRQKRQRIRQKLGELKL